MGTIADTQDQTLDAAASAFGALDAPEQPREEGEQPDENGIDIPEEGEDNTEQEGDEPSEPNEDQPEPDQPAIEPPARFTADQKAIFATLPRDAQQVFAASFQDQERAIGQKAEEAASARKAAETVAANTLQLHQNYAQQLETFAAMVMPQQPDPSLARTDPQAYIQQKAYYDAAMAQHGSIMQHAQQARQQATNLENTQTQRARAEDFQRLISAIPEAKDEAKRAALYQEWQPTADALGYPRDMMTDLNSYDHVALKTAHEWRTKAEKWDQAQQAKMATVRSAKPSPKVATPGTAQPKGSERARGFNDSMNRLRQSGDVRDAAAAFRNLR